MGSTNEEIIKPHAVLLQSKELYKYILQTSVYPREAAPLKELREATATHHMSFYATAPDAGQLVALLLKMVNAKQTIEIGVYTGYSLLLAALTIPDDGKITAIDINRTTYEMGLPIMKKAGVEHKINFIESPALPVLDKHERLMKLIKIGGIVVYDNTLWGGTVVLPEDDVPEFEREGRKSALEFNQKISADPRVEICLAPLGDGITICRRIS